MIGKHSRGWNVGGLLRYLMGPGRSNEHTEQRVVAAWTGNPAALAPAMKDPASLVSERACGFDVRDLATQLTTPAHFGGVSLTRPAPDAKGKVPAGPVWHCSLRNHESDRLLTDAEWAEVAADVMHRTGIAPRGDRGACRWVAIRHAPDHIHLAAVLVRQDTGRKVHLRHDWPATMEACHAAEDRYGLVSTAPADRTALAKPTRAEVEKAARRYVDPKDPDRSAEPARTWLARTVREAAISSGDLESFRHELADRQVEMQMRTYRGRDGVVFGMPGDRTRTGEQLWFAGSTLAPDLSLPKLRERWAATPGELPRHRVGIGKGTQAERQIAERDALVAIDAATDTITAALSELRATGEDATPDPQIAERIAAIIHATGDMTTVLDVRIESWRHTSRWASQFTDREAAQIPRWVFDRAARQPGVGQPRSWNEVATALRISARGVARLQPGGAELVLALIALIAEIAAWHEQTRHLAQAHAARCTPDLLNPLRARPAGHPEQPTAPSRTRHDSRRPGPSRTTGRTEQSRRFGGPNQKRLAQLRREITEKAMSRRPDAAHTDTELTELIAQARQHAATTRDTARQLRTELDHLEPRVAAGRGPNVARLHADLVGLWQCARLHQDAAEHHRRATEGYAHARQLWGQMMALRKQAGTGRLRLPGQRSRLYTQAAELEAQAQAVNSDAHQHGKDADQLRKAAAQHGPADPARAYAELHGIQQGWQRWLQRARDTDTRRVAELCAELAQADTDTAHADDTTGRLIVEQRHRQTQPVRRRAAENEVRRLRAASAEPHRDAYAEAHARARIAEERGSPAAAALRAAAALTPPTPPTPARNTGPKATTKPPTPAPEQRVITPKPGPNPGRGRGR